MNIPRIIISAIRGGAGKSLLSLGLCRACQLKGLSVKTYKKGPDYIDAQWLTRASNSTCTNLDPFFLTAHELRNLCAHAWNIKEEGSYDIAIIEGNRGLFDGQDLQGSCSTAELARTLNAPVLLSIDVTKSTRTTAALIHGLQTFEKNLHIGGVVLNQVASKRHENIVRQSIEHYTNVPVLGAIPRLKENPLPERHMGLSPAHNHQNTYEHENKKEIKNILDNIGALVQEHCNIDAIVQLANAKPQLEQIQAFWPKTSDENNPSTSQASIPIGYVHDVSLWFYYAENLEALQRAGANLIPLSLLDPTPWPKNLKGLYLGGGFPEEYLQTLSTSPHMDTIRELSHKNIPIYAECGGFMVLSQAVVRHGQEWPMANIFPTHAVFHEKPQGLGYVHAQVSQKNPFHPIGSSLRGHEFHYSRCVPQKQLTPTLTLTKGKGMGIPLADTMTGDGLCIRNTFAAYTHIFAPTCPWWAQNFVNLARSV